MSKKLLFILSLAAAACSRPVADFTYQGELIAPARVRFENKSEKAESFLWHFGDGDTSSVTDPEHRFTTSGNYAVRLEAIQGKKRRSAETVIQVKAPEKCLVELSTDYGTMLIELFDATPRHRDNFIKLADEGFFDNLLFHRVINGFMIQGGDPRSRDAAPGQPLGSGGPGYTIPAEFVDSLVHVKGMLAAARLSDQANPKKESSGSQFYIVQGGGPLSDDVLGRYEARKGLRYSSAQREAYLKWGGTPSLDREYTVFGRVIEGMEVIDRIAAVSTGPGDRPIEDVRMKVRVIK